MIAVGYTFAAWLCAGFFIYAGFLFIKAPPGRVALHCSAVLACFIPVFRLYFSRAGSLSPAAAAGVAVLFIMLLDLILIGPYFPRRWDFFFNFWEWQLPAMLVASSIYLTGRSAARKYRDVPVTSS
jgi:hypothetical protein